ncbi:MAG: MFS transporter [Dehalococcoidia bacterium]|nr:MFS transporter [Dehalococcoidia bacterium]
MAITDKQQAQTAEPLVKRMFSALQYRDFRFLWVSQVSAGFSQQAEILARSWLILEMGGSATEIGLVHVTRTIGQFAITPVAGVLGDRIDRRILILAANLVNVIFFALLGVLIITGHIALWHIMASAVIAGAAMTMDQIGRQAAIPALVPKEGLMNAIALGSVLIGTSRILGPGLAGIMIKFVGVQGAYFMMAVALVLPIVMVMFIKPIRIRDSKVGESFFSSFKVGLQFVAKNQQVRALMLVQLTCVMFAMAFQLMMPVYVKQSLGMGVGTLAILAALPGTLTLFGGFYAASLGDYKYKGRLIYISTMSPGIAIIIMGFSDSFVVAILALLMFGALSSQFMPSNQSAIMKVVPRELQGRVAGTASLASSMGTVGVIFYGLVSDRWGIDAAFITFGAISCTLLTLYFIFIKSFRNAA